MDVRAENRGRPRQKVRFPAAPVVGRNFLTPGHPGVRVRNVRRKSGLKSLCLCCFSFPVVFCLRETRKSMVFCKFCTPKLLGPLGKEGNLNNQECSVNTCLQAGILRGPATILFISRNTCSDSIGKGVGACFFFLFFFVCVCVSMCFCVFLFCV